MSVPKLFVVGHLPSWAVRPYYRRNNRRAQRRIRASIVAYLTDCYLSASPKTISTPLNLISETLSETLNPTPETFPSVSVAYTETP